MNIAAIYPIRPLYDDPNVSLIKDGSVVFAYEEEKLSRARRELSGPKYQATALCAALNRAGLRPDQIDLWALVGGAPDVLNDFTALLNHIGLIQFVPHLRINRVPHHLAHAALSVFTAPFEECLYVSMDHEGKDVFSAVLGSFAHNQFREIHRSTGVHLADFWSDMTSYLGFRTSEEERVVGLAAYGHPDEKLYRQLASIVRIGEDGLGVVYRQPRRTMQQHLDPFHCGGFSLTNAPFPRFDFSSVPYLREVGKPDIAATVQKLIEDYVREIISRLVRKTGLRQVALCGSLFRNPKLNGVVHEIGEVAAVHVPMAPGDDGLSLGAALHTLWERSGRRCEPAPLSPYLGPSFDNRNIEEAVRAFGLRYRLSANAAGEAAAMIAQGRMVGWFQESGEYGPRSLGARSVLADPRDPRAKERINKLLKNPHWFAPLAVSILEEHADEFFENGCSSPYMNMALRVRDDKVRLIPSAVHADGRSIPQTVGKHRNGRYYELIEEFRRLTGLPLLLNAGFSLCGVPAVCTPRQALEHLCMGCVDVLAIGDYIVDREFLPKEEPQGADSEARLVAHLRAVPVVDLALAGKTRRAQEVCSRLGIPGGNGIEALILALANAPQSEELAGMLMEQLTTLIETSGIVQKISR
jgi:carbamoyltransferase